MNYIEIKSIEHPLFLKAWKLYKKSFPQEERRELRTQKRIINHPFYHFRLITDSELFVGFVLWWEFDDVRYIEHLATHPSLRGKGYGNLILEKFVSESSIPVLLEVEHPTSNISQRRIGFYERCGFVLNPHRYKHPPYKRRGEYVSLMLMTFPNAITEAEAQHFVDKHHPVIHEFVLSNWIKQRMDAQPPEK